MTIRALAFHVQQTANKARPRLLRPGIGTPINPGTRTLRVWDKLKGTGYFTAGVSELMTHFPGVVEGTQTTQGE
jgi:hypothetical protein